MDSSPTSSLRASSSDIRDGESKRQARKLQKKRRDMPSSSVEFPERLKDDDPSDDEDRNLATPMSMNMNQSFFGLIAAAGSSVDFNTRFEGNSSDEEEDEDLSQTTVLDPSKRKPPPSRKQRNHTKNRLLKSLASLPKRKSRTKKEPSKLSQADQDDDDLNVDDADTLPPAPLDDDDNRIAPVMSRILQAEEEMSSRPSFDIQRKPSDAQKAKEAPDATPLAIRLMEIFEFDQPEQVIEGRNC